MELMDEVINNFKRFHPKPEEVQCSNPVAEPDFIKPQFGLRLFPSEGQPTQILAP